MLRAAVAVRANPSPASRSELLDAAAFAEVVVDAASK
jgi:hypothetical protein